MSLWEFRTFFVAQVSTATYAAHMSRLYEKIRAALPANGTVVFATTTPVPPTYPSRERVNADVLSINAALLDLFGPTGLHAAVRVDDLYNAVVGNCRAYAASACYPDTCDCPRLQNDGVHFSDVGKRFLGVLVASYIARYQAGPGRGAAYVGDDDDAGDDDDGELLASWQWALVAQGAAAVGLVAAVSAAAWRGRAKDHPEISNAPAKDIRACRTYGDPARAPLLE